MLVDEILERNRAFVRGREARPLPPVEAKPLVVVACYDPRLDPLLLQALGIEHGEAFLLRTAGALVLPGGGVMRSLGLAVFMFGATEILVVGHTSCRMATFSNAGFIDMFRARGVPREAFGTGDLREWAGAIASPARGVAASVANISSVPFLPPDVTVSGAVLDDTTGELRIVVRGGQAPVLPAEEIPPDPAAAPAAPAPSDEVAPLVSALADVLAGMEQQGDWGYELQQLRAELTRAPSPLAKLRLVESFLRRASGDARVIARSIAGLRDALAAAGPGRTPESLARLLDRLSGGAS
jgi:carbonic anhydrase